MSRSITSGAFFIKLLVIVAAPLLFSVQANAVLLSFQNGGFEGYTGDTDFHNATVPPGWTTTDGTPDTFDGNTSFASYTWAPSSTGGDFLHGIGNQPSWTESALQVGLDGLVIGQQYEISFEQSISRSTWSETGGFWKIKFGDEIQDSDHMDIPDFGVFEGWDWQTLLFTATSTIQTLEVIAWSDTDGLRTDIGIDSFFLGDPGGNPDNPDNPTDPDPVDPTPSVPEPSTLMIFVLGALMFALSRRRVS
jgi:hypothetical protein